MKKYKIIVCIAASAGLLTLGALTYTGYINSHQYKEDMVTNAENNDYETNDILNTLNANKKSKVIMNTTTSSRVVSLSLEGLTDEDTMNQILELLNKYDIKATFIVSGIEAAENADIVKKIKDEGHEIGSASLNAEKNIDKVSEEELIHDFSKANNIIEDIINDKVNLLKCRCTEYTDEVLEAAYISGNEYVLDSSIYLSYQSFKNYEETYGYINRLKNGSILSVKLNRVLDETEYSNQSNEEKPAIDKRAGIKEKDEIKEEQATILEVLEWMLRALSQNKRAVVKVTDLVNLSSQDNSIFDEYLYDYRYQYIDKRNYSNTVAENDSTQNNTSHNIKDEEKEEKQYESEVNNDEIDLNSIDFENLIEINNKKTCDINSQIYTTKNSVSYTFRGLSNEKSLDYVLESLKKINGKGTFFVTKDEIENYPDRINKIIEYGNEIGNGGVTNNSKLLNKTPVDIAKEIYEVGIMLKNRGIETNAYMPGYGYINENVEEAVSALKNLDDFKNYELFTYSKSPVISKYKEWNAYDIISDYFNTNTYLSLRKGEIVYFRLDSELFSDDMTIGDMVNKLTENYVKSGYINRYDSKKNIYELIQRPLNYSVVTLKEMQEKEGGKRYKLNNNPSHLPQRTTKEADKVMSKNYIGNIYVDLYGFSENEQLQMDKEGFIDTSGESAVFFTFDDWGSDVVVNELLDVLKKHNVKATFFALGKYVDINSDISNANPNLLRTIALEGHDIGSHTYDHDRLDVDKEKLKVSLNKSYEAMNMVIGDLNSLKPLFRPPTLYINKSGLEAAFESGYDYVVNGNISTHDYEAGSADELLEGMESELVKNKGNVVVMHMNNQASYTAEALDKFLTRNEEGFYGEKFKIAKLSDYLK